MHACMRIAGNGWVCDCCAHDNSAELANCSACDTRKSGACHLTLCGQYGFWVLDVSLPRWIYTPEFECQTHNGVYGVKLQNHHITQLNGFCQVMCLWFCLVHVGVQMDIPETCSKTGVDIIGFGTSEQGLRAVRMTVDFFIHVLRCFMAQPNVAVLIQRIHADWADQLNNRQERLRVQLLEGRTRNGKEAEHVPELQQFIRRAFSRHTLRLIWHYYWTHQGEAQLRAHDQGTASSFASGCNVSLCSIGENSVRGSGG